jgi:site-specific recombinase XerD
MDTIMEPYRLYLRNQHKEEATIKSYVHEAESFLGWCSVHNVDFTTLSQQMLIEYRDALLTRGVKVATVNKSVSMLSTFFKWALSTGLLNTNFARRIRLPDAKKELQPRWLTSDEEERLLAAVRNESTVFQRARNEALISLMLYAGVRVEEVTQLPLAAVRNDRIDIYDNGFVVRTVPLPDITQGKLMTWVAIRTASVKQAHAESPWLFVTERSGAMQARAVQFVVESYSDKLGISISCQALRNTYCRRLVEGGAAVEQVKMLAGHKTMLTTWKYYR